MNRYAYVLGNPVTLIDHLGNRPDEPGMTFKGKNKNGWIFETPTPRPPGTVISTQGGGRDGTDYCHTWEPCAKTITYTPPIHKLCVAGNPAACSPEPKAPQTCGGVTPSSCRPMTAEEDRLYREYSSNVVFWMGIAVDVGITFVPIGGAIWRVVRVGDRIASATRVADDIASTPLVCPPDTRESQPPI